MEWARLVPELGCSDFARSLAFYRDVLGFAVQYERAEERFAYLDLGGAQVMLEQAKDHWAVGALEPPYGRGLNLEIAVDRLAPLEARLADAGVTLFRAPFEAWRRCGETVMGARELLVQDPDGYLLRFSEFIGERPASAEDTP